MAWETRVGDPPVHPSAESKGNVRMGFLKSMKDAMGLGYWGRTLTGVALMLAAVAAIAFSIWKLTRIGTCVSGGPYVSARECPSGSPLYGIGIAPCLYAFLLGAWLFATRGRTRAVPSV
jgi:hypothetical protein